MATNNTNYTPLPIPMTDTCKLTTDIFDTRRDIMQLGYDRTADVLSSADRQQYASENRQNRISDHIVDTVYRTAEQNLAATDRNGTVNLSATQTGVGQLGVQAEKLMNETITYNSQGFAAVQAQSALNGFNAQKNTGEVLFRIKDTQCELSDRIGDYFNKTQVDAHVNVRALERQASDNFCKSQQDVARLENSLGRLADSHFAQSQLLNATGFANTRADVRESQMKLELQAAQNTAAIQLEAQKTKLDIISKMAECCCEIKEKIGDSDASTKALITAVQTTDIRDQLQQSQTKNLILQNDLRGFGGFGFGHGGHHHGGHHGGGRRD